MKRGLGSIVATVLIVLLCVAAVAVISVTSNRFIKKNLSESQVEIVRAQIQSSMQLVSWENKGPYIQATIKRTDSNSDEKITGIQFKLTTTDTETSGNFCYITITPEPYLNAHETQTYLVPTISCVGEVLNLEEVYLFFEEVSLASPQPNPAQGTPAVFLNYGKINVTRTIEKLLTGDFKVTVFLNISSDVNSKMLVINEKIPFGTKIISYSPSFTKGVDNRTLSLIFGVFNPNLVMKNSNFSYIVRSLYSGQEFQGYFKAYDPYYQAGTVGDLSLSRNEKPIIQNYSEVCNMTAGKIYQYNSIGQKVGVSKDCSDFFCTGPEYFDANTEVSRGYMYCSQNPGCYDSDAGDQSTGGFVVSMDYQGTFRKYFDKLSTDKRYLTEYSCMAYSSIMIEDEIDLWAYNYSSCFNKNTGDSCNMKGQSGTCLKINASLSYCLGKEIFDDPYLKDSSAWNAPGFAYGISGDPTMFTLVNKTSQYKFSAMENKGSIFMQKNSLRGKLSQGKKYYLSSNIGGDCEIQVSVCGNTVKTTPKGSLNIELNCTGANPDFAIIPQLPCNDLRIEQINYFKEILG